MHIKYARTKRGDHHFRYAAVINNDAFIIDVAKWKCDGDKWGFFVTTSGGTRKKGPGAFKTLHEARKASFEFCAGLTIPTLKQEGGRA